MVPCASALPPAAAPSAGPVRGWPRAPGSGPRGFSAAEPGGGLKTRAARGSPRGRPGSPSAAGGARRLGVGARGRAAPPRSRARSPPAVPALAPRGRQGRRGVGARSSLRGPVSAETPRARAVGRRRPRPRQQGAETRVSAPRPRRALGGVACRAVSGVGQRAPRERRRRRWRRRRRRRSFRAGAHPRPRRPPAPRRLSSLPARDLCPRSPPGSALGLAGRAERAGGRAGVGASRSRSPRGGAESGRRSSFRCRPVGRPAARPREVPPGRVRKQERASEGASGRSERGFVACGLRARRERAGGRRAVGRSVRRSSAAVPSLLRRGLVWPRRARRRRRRRGARRRRGEASGEGGGAAVAPPCLAGAGPSRAPGPASKREPGSRRARGGGRERGLPSLGRLGVSLAVFFFRTCARTVRGGDARSAAAVVRSVGRSFGRGASALGGRAERPRPPRARGAAPKSQTTLSGGSLGSCVDEERS